MQGPKYLSLTPSHCANLNNESLLRQAGYLQYFDLGQHELFTELEGLLSRRLVDSWLLASVTCDEERKVVRKIAIGQDLTNEKAALELIQGDATLVTCSPKPLLFDMFGQYQVLEMSKCSGVSLEDHLKIQVLTEEQQNVIIDSLLIFLDGFTNIVNDKVARADKNRGPLWNGINLDKPLLIQVFLEEVIRWYTDDLQVQDWAAREIQGLNDGWTVLTHLDLTPGNILIDPEKHNVIGLIDWEKSGFYPQWFQWFDLGIWRLSGYFYETLFTKMRPKEYMALEPLGRLIKALHTYASPLMLYEARAQQRNKVWESVQEICGLENVPAPAFNYRKAIPVMGGSGPFQPEWEDSPASSPLEWALRLSEESNGFANEGEN